MKTKHVLLSALLSFCSLGCQLPGFAQGTAFTYQGRLNAADRAANGRYDFTFSIWIASGGPGQVGSTLTNLNVEVADGLFQASLDFGQSVFTGAERWLEIGVRTNGGGAFTPLTPRQALAAAPYAITAATITGPVPSASLGGAYSGAVSLTNLLNTFNGTFTGNGAGLTGLSADQLAGGTVPAAALSNAWKLGGNAGTAPEVNFVGTTDGRPLDFRVNNLRALRLEPTENYVFRSNIVNVIGGSPANFARPGVYGATIAGGGAVDYMGPGTNSVLADFGTVGGGWLNTIEAGAYSSVIGGGQRNRISASRSWLGGGEANFIGAAAQWSTIGGGLYNAIPETYPEAEFATIGGGSRNTNASVRATIAGGDYNTIKSSAWNAAIGGGNSNTIEENASSSAISGGIVNRIQWGAADSVISGGYSNTIAKGAQHSAIAGGLAQLNAAQFAAISGGRDNVIQSNAVYAAVGGGWRNSVGTNSDSSVISGGEQNTIAGNVSRAAIAGGYLNDIATNASSSAIGGGRGNRIAAGSAYSVAAGGYANLLGTNAGYGVIGGGLSNRIADNGTYGTIPGGRENTATNYAFAAGRRAKARHLGAFVWADSTDADFASTASNQVLIRASGGVGIGTTAPRSTLHVNGSTTVETLFTLGTASVTLTNSATLQPVSSSVSVTGAGWPVTLDATAAIADGTAEGQLLILYGDSYGHDVTIPNGANTRLGSASRTIGPNDSLMLLWSGHDWLELAYSDNS